MSSIARTVIYSITSEDRAVVTAMLVEAVTWVLLMALARAQRVLVTSLEDNTMPVFEVFDPEADQVLGLVTLYT